MGSIYQPSYTDRQGVKRKSKVWRISYKDEAGRWQNVAGYKDKKASQEKLRQLELRTDRIAAGLPVEGDGQMHKGITEAADEWAAELRRLGRTQTYLYENSRVVQATATALGWKRLSDVDATAFRRHLGELATAGKSARTVNYCREKWAFFLNWCVAQKWLNVNPLGAIRTAKSRRGPKARRAFTVDE